MRTHAGRYQWLRDFVDGFEGDSSLALRPNFAYALPLAALRQQQEVPADGASSSSSGGAAATAQQQQQQHGSPQQQLAQAILLHPSVVPR